MERKPDPVKKKVLGRGLSALLPEDSVLLQEEPGSTESGVLQIPLAKVRAGSLQPRKSFPPEELAELAASIKEKGVLQPVLVRPMADGCYELVAGERRFRAAENAGLAKIPALVRKLSDREALEVAIVENVQRADLNAIELAEGYSRLLRDFSLSQEQVAERVGKDRATVANTIRLLRLPAQVRQALADGKLTAGHARALLSAPAEQIPSIFEIVMRRGLSVRDTEQLCTRENRKKPARKPVQANSDMKALEEELTRRGKTRVRLCGDAKKGRIEVYYFSSEELDRLQEILFGER